MHKLALVGLGVLLLVATAVTVAQSGGGFDLSWSTIDGGSRTSSGGGFVLNGTIGQADAGGPISGGSFALNGGFWQPSCAVPQAVANESIQPASGSVQLSWASGAATFNIYRAANDPYFTPETAYATSSGSPWLDPDGAVMSNINANYSYLIRANNDCGESVNSQRLGEFDFALVAGS